MNRPICEKVGDWHRSDYPTMRECATCSSNKCPIACLIKNVNYNYTLIKSYHVVKK